MKNSIIIMMFLLSSFVSASVLEDISGIYVGNKANDTKSFCALELGAQWESNPDLAFSFKVLKENGDGFQENHNFTLHPNVALERLEESLEIYLSNVHISSGYSFPKPSYYLKINNYENNQPASFELRKSGRFSDHKKLKVDCVNLVKL